MHKPKYTNSGVFQKFTIFNVIHYKRINTTTRQHAHSFVSVVLVCLYVD
jgi:hypothetical protein